MQNLKFYNYEKKFFSGFFALALLATAGFGVNRSLNSDASLSGLALSNVEALGQGETGREDCQPAIDFCEEFVKYPDGWGIDILFDHEKKQGWA